MAAAECIPVTIANGNEAEDMKKINGANGDHAEAESCLKNGKTCDNGAEGAPETNTDNSNTESSEPSEKTETPGNTGDEEVCEDEPAVGTEEIGEYDERMNGHNKKDEEGAEEGGESNDAEDGCDDAEDGVATKRPADDGECDEEPSKKFCTEAEGDCEGSEEAKATSE